MSNPAPTLNQINAFNATQGTTIDFNIIGGTEVIRSNKIYIYDLSDNSLICTHLYVSTESIHELPSNTSSSIVYASGKSSADFTNNTQYYAQIQTFTDVGGTQGGSGLSIAKLFWCLPTPTLTLSTIPTTISTTSYNVSATYTPNTSGGATNEIQEFQFNLYSAIGALLQTSGVVLYGEGVDLSYNFSGLEVDSTYYVTLDVTTTQGMNVSAQSNTFTVSIDTPTMGSASVVNNGCDGYISVTSNLSSEYEHEESVGSGEIMSFTTDSVNDITELDVDFSPVQDGTPWMSTQNTEPYTFRAVPTQTEDFGHESDTIIGGTVAWNQLIDPKANTIAGVPVTVSNGKFTFSGTVSASGGGRTGDLSDPRPTIISGHKYLLLTTLNTTGIAGFFLNLASAVSTYFSFGKGNTVANATFSGEAIFGANLTANAEINTSGYIQLFDLTKLFGSTIADYIYSLEQSTTGAGVAWFRKLFPNDYYPYDAGSLVSVSGLTSHDMVGFNQWDEEWELGTINATTGQNDTSTIKYRCKNYIPVLPNATYYFRATVGTTYNLFFYDVNKNFLSVIGKNANSTFVIPSNAYYMRFYKYVEDTSYDHDICINLSDASLNGTYKPYVKHSYPLDSTLTLRGIPKLDASNNLYYDGDTYESDGTVTRKYKAITFDGSVDEAWSYSYDNSLGRGRVYITGIQGLMPNTANVIGNYVQGNSSQKSYPLLWNAYVNITPVPVIGVPASITSVGDWQTYLASQPLTLIMELATTTTESADPYTNPQIVDPSGTEEYVGSPIPVGHKTTYQRICPITGWTGCEVDVSGVNVWDEEWERGYIVGGVEYASDGCIRSKNYNPCVGGETYYLYCGSATNQYFCRPIFYDAEKNFVSNGAWCANGTITAPSNARYFRLTTQSASSSYYGGTYKNDISFNFPSTDHNYHAYQGTTYISTFPKYKQQVSQDKTPYITKNIGDTYADTLTENLVGGTIAWNQSVPDTTTTHTVSGSIASMDDAVAGNFESVVCDIDPVQDLHGYDKPWVGGAGVNKAYYPTLTRTSQNGIDYTLSADGNTLKFYGTATANSECYAASLSNDYSQMPLGVYPAGTYTSTAKGFVGGATGDRIVVNARYSDGTSIIASRISGAPGVIADGSGYPQTFTATQPFKIGIYTFIASGSQVDCTATIQLEQGSSVGTWTPYENICPISGWDGVSAYVTDEQYYIPSNTTIGKNWIGGTDTKRAINTFNINGGETYRVVTKGGNFEAILFIQMNGYSQISNADITPPYNNQITLDANCNKIIVQFQKNTDIITSDFSDFVCSVSKEFHDYTTSLGTTVYGGTIDLVSGVLTVTHGYVDLGTLTWVATTTNVTGKYRMRSTLTDAPKIPPTTSTIANILCEVYEAIPSSNTNIPQQGISIDGSGYIRCYDERYNTSASANDFKTAVNGIKFVYELATPTTYQLDPVQVACLLGQNNVWNNISNTTVTYPTNHSYQSLSTTHKYYKRLNGVESISVGSDVVADVGTDNIIDLTQMFGTTIADYIYNIEQSSSSGMGVKFFKSLFPSNDYDYNSGELISVNASAHVIKDANGNVLHTYPLDSDLVLRGIPKLDANNKLYYDGDVYASSGNVTRKYGIVDLGSLNWEKESTDRFRITTDIGAKLTASTSQLANIICSKYTTDIQAHVTSRRYDKIITGLNWGSGIIVRDSTYSTSTDFKTAMSGVYLVYELATPTTETADPFEENQTIIPNGIEEYTVTEQGDVEMPVGHDSTYYATEVYGGTIDMASGVLTIDNKVVDLGSLTWTKVSNNNYANFYTSDLASDIVYNATTPTVMCSQYKPEANNTALASDDGYIWVNAQKTVRIKDTSKANMTIDQFKAAMDGVQLVYELATPIEISLTPQQMQTLSGQNNIWSNTNGGMSLIYQLPITSLLVKRRDVADVSGKWLTLYSVPITQASDMDFTFIDFLNQYGKTYQYALVPVLEQDQSGVIVQIEGGYTVSDNVDSIFDGVYIADQTNVERVKAGAGYGNIDMNQGVGSITPIGSKYPIVITNSQNQYHNGSIRGTIVPNDFYSNGNLSRIDMVNKRDELEQFLTNKRAKIIKDWNGKIWLVMIMSNVSCSFDDNYGMGMVSFSADWLEVGDPTNQQDLYNAGLINVGGV